MIHRLGPPEPTVAPPPSDRPPLGSGYVAPMIIGPGEAVKLKLSNDARLEFWTNAIIKIAFALGFAGFILACAFAVSYLFLRWVLA